MIARVSEGMYLMCAQIDGKLRYAPLYIHSIRLVVYRSALEYRRYEDITCVRDRLRWCRHQKGLMQKEVAMLVGTSRSVYVDMEEGLVDQFQKGTVDKLAALYGVPADDLLDDYNRFLYYGQGEAIRACRERLGLSQKAFARLVMVDPGNISVWELEKKRVSRISWEKYFKDRVLL